MSPIITIDNEYFTEIYLSKVRFKRIHKKFFSIEMYTADIDDVFYFKKPNKGTGYYPHSLKTPSIIRKNSYKAEHWYKNGFLHRNNGFSNKQHCGSKNISFYFLGNSSSEESYWNK